MNNNTTNQIAVFLDVDGVINSLNHLYEDGDFNMSAPVSYTHLTLPTTPYV